MTSFENRRQAGRALARELSAYAGRSDVIVLALPRGGVPVGYEIAEALGALGCIPRPQAGGAGPRGAGNGSDRLGRR
jgi:orotate phosphoribosyltransferase